MKRRFIRKSTDDTQNSPPCAYCGECMGEVYEEDPVYCIDGHIVCFDCFEQFAKEYFSHAIVKGMDLRKEDDTYEAW